MNGAMRVALAAFAAEGTQGEARALPDELIEIVRRGFVFDDGCVFLRALFGTNGNATLKDFPDRTGYECFVNSVRVDDYAGDAHLGAACRFAQALLEAWRAGGEGGVGRVILSSDEFGSVVKFHLERVGEEWLSGSLEGYAEAILQADSLETESLIPRAAASRAHSLSATVEAGSAMEIIEFLKTIYLGDRACKSVLIDGWNDEVKVQVTCISRIRSSTWNFHTAEDLVDGFLVFEGVSSVRIEPPGAIPNDLIHGLEAERLPGDDALHAMCLSVGGVDASGADTEVRILVLGKSVALEAANGSGQRIRS